MTSTYRWNLVLLNGKRESMNMPYLNGEPDEESIKDFLKAFRPYIYSQLIELPGIASITWEYTGEYSG